MTSTKLTLHTVEAIILSVVEITPKQIRWLHTETDDNVANFIQNIVMV